MLQQETRSDDRRESESKHGDRRLRRGVPVAAGVVAGYLLWRWYDRRGGGGRAASDRRGPTAIASRIRERATAGGSDAGPDVGTDSVDVPIERKPRAERSGGEADREAATVPAGVEPDDVEEAVAALSTPSVRGMPMLGVGTHHHADYDECYRSVRQALRTGYRHVDTTVMREAYYNEPAVGDAVDDADAAREDVFVATKVDPADLDADHVRISVEESLDRLEMEYVDLLYARWPTEEYEADETMAAFADLREEGLVEEIGVSNFTVDLLEEAVEASPAPIFANQVEMHPLLPQADLREFCEREGIEVVAYSPLARGDVEDVDELREVAAKHDATPEQVSLAWLREKGVTAIPRATTEAHLRENWLSLGVDLDREDVATLDAIEERRRIVDPDDAPWNR